MLREADHMDTFCFFNVLYLLMHEGGSGAVRRLGWGLHQKISLTVSITKVKETSLSVWKMYLQAILQSESCTKCSAHCLFPDCRKVSVHEWLRQQWLCGKCSAQEKDEGWIHVKLKTIYQIRKIIYIIYIYKRNYFRPCIMMTKA